MILDQSFLSVDRFIGTAKRVVRSQQPMTSTTILYPLGDDVSETEVRKQRYLEKQYGMKEGEDVTFDNC